MEVCAASSGRGREDPHEEGERNRTTRMWKIMTKNVEDHDQTTPAPRDRSVSPELTTSWSDDGRDGRRSPGWPVIHPVAVL